MGVYGPHTQFKCLLEAMIFGTCKKNIIMYSQMRFQPYQSHSLTVTGVTYIGHYISTLYITYIRHYISALFNLSFMFIHCHKR